MKVTFESSPIKYEIDEKVYIYYAVWWSYPEFYSRWAKLKIYFEEHEYRSYRQRYQQVKKLQPFTMLYYNNIVQELS